MTRLFMITCTCKGCYPGGGGPVAAGDPAVRGGPALPRIIIGRSATGIELRERVITTGSNYSFRSSVASSALRRVRAVAENQEPTPSAL